jgi:hypothetical protein
VTLTATVAGNNISTPTGTIDFFDTSTNTDLGTVHLVAATASLSTAFATVGTHVIQAGYSGDANYLPSSAAFTQTVLSAQQELAVIIGQVNSMVAQGILDPGNGNALISKLNNAINSLNAGNTIAGDNQMNAFINQVNALTSKKLDSTDAQMLVSEIDLAINATLTNPI